MIENTSPPPPLPPMPQSPLVSSASSLLGKRARLETGLREAGQMARRERAWLWLLVPYLFAWVVPAEWSRDQWGDPNHALSFQPLIPFLAGLLAWGQRNEIAVQKAHLVRQWKTRDWRLKPSSAVLFLGLALFLFSHIVQVKGFVVMALWLIAVGTLWRVYNGLTVGLLWKPLLVALLVIPPPDSIIDAFAHLLQAQSVSGAAFLLRATHLSRDAWGIGWTINVKGAPILLPPACSGLNTLLPLLVLFGCYLLYVKASPLRNALLLLLGGIAALSANVVRIMVVGLLQQNNPDLSSTISHANTYLLIVPLLLLLIAVDQKTRRRLETEKLTDGTLRVAAGAGVAVGFIFRPLDWIVKGVGGLFGLFTKSERGLEKLLSRLVPKKKSKRNRW